MFGPPRPQPLPVIEFLAGDVLDHLTSGSVLSAAGCTFDQDSDPGFCDYRQGQDDDFDWQLIRTYSWPHPTPDLLRGTTNWEVSFGFEVKLSGL